MQSCNRYGDCYSPEDALAHYFGDYEEEWSDDWESYDDYEEDWSDSWETEWDTTEPFVDPVPEPIVNDSTWSSSATYNAGDVVSWNGNDYEAKWWTQGDNPENSG